MAGLHSSVCVRVREFVREREREREDNLKELKYWLALKG